jgi:hypothetical protein
MAVIIRELTECYKCHTPIMAERGIVHPLCGGCQESFDAWFALQIAEINSGRKY